MTLTLQMPDEFVGFVPGNDAELASLLAAGLRQRRSRERGEILNLADVAETLANLPSPEEVLAMRPSAQLAERTVALIDKRRTGALTADEQCQWDEIAQIEHLVRIAKARALTKLNAATVAA